jgi:hypothetical protein
MLFELTVLPYLGRIFLKHHLLNKKSIIPITFISEIKKNPIIVNKYFLNDNDYFLDQSIYSLNSKPIIVYPSKFLQAKSETCQTTSLLKKTYEIKEPQIIEFMNRVYVSDNKDDLSEHISEKYTPYAGTLFCVGLCCVGVMILSTGAMVLKIY